MHCVLLCNILSQCSQDEQGKLKKSPLCENCPKLPYTSYAMQSLYILCPKDKYTKYYWGCNHCTTIYTFGFLRCFFQNTAQDNLNTSPPVFLCLFVSSLFVFIRMLSALECLFVCFFVCLFHPCLYLSEC